MSERSTCVICGGRALEGLHTFKEFPVRMSCTTQARAQDITMDMAWDICATCGAIQLKHLVPIDVLYAENHNDAVGKTWSDHNEAFSRFVESFAPERVFEIGGGSGKIAKLSIARLGGRLRSWTILEPNPLLDFSDPKLVVRRAWLNDISTADGAKIDSVIHSHVMEHFYSPDQELARIRQLFPPGHKMIFSVPNLSHWLKAKFFNALMFEHSYHLDPRGLDYLAAKNGYSLVAAETFREHSLFFCFQNTEATDTEVNTHVPDQYRQNKETFLNYVSDARAQGEKIAQKIKELPPRTPVFLFGAHIFAQILLHCGVKEHSLKGILDNSKLKHGKRLYGHELIVSPPEVLAALPTAAVILRAGAYQAEIEAQLNALLPGIHWL